MKVISCETLIRLNNENILDSIDDIDITFFRFRNEYNEKIVDIISRCVNLKFLKLYTHDPIINLSELANLQNLIKFDVKIFRDYTFCLSTNKKNLIYVYCENNYKQFVNCLCTENVENIIIFIPNLSFYFNIMKILPICAKNVKFVLVSDELQNISKNLLGNIHFENLPISMKHIKLTIFYTPPNNFKGSTCFGMGCNKTIEHRRPSTYRTKHYKEHVWKKYIDDKCCFCIIENKSLLTSKTKDIAADLTYKLCNTLKLPFGCNYEIEIIST